MQFSILLIGSIVSKYLQFDFFKYLSDPEVYAIKASDASNFKCLIHLNIALPQTFPCPLVMHVIRYLRMGVNYNKTN